MSTNGDHDGPVRLLRLVQLCDSALPIGSYSHSWGLEAAIDRKAVTGPSQLEAWARSWLSQSVAPGDGIVFSHAYRAAAAGDWETLASLNDLLTANKVSTTLRRVSLKQGESLLALAATWPWSGAAAAYLRAAGPGPWHQSIVFALLAQAAGASAREALALFLQNALVGIVSAAVRAVPIGHTHGQQILARLQSLVAELAEQSVNQPLESFGSLSPTYEVLSYAQSQLYTRIFQS